MMKIYFERTEGNNNVMITDGETVKIYDAAPTGIFEGVDLYAEDAAEKLALHFAELASNGTLNDFNDMFSENEMPLEDVVDELLSVDTVIVYDDSKRIYADDGGEIEYFVIRESADEYSAHAFQQDGDGWKHWEMAVTVTVDMLAAAVESYGPENAGFLAAMDELQQWGPEPVKISDEEKSDILKRIGAGRKTADLLDEAVAMGFSREEALESIDAALDDKIGIINREDIRTERISDELYRNIISGFQQEAEYR